ncbi:rho GTPase-activating protein 15-like [Leptopilina boulardi]|uniref:rho GTPase-activating protein 15-like n=1 Tax=Leptopilina boulardi TaxID=63433 RepID=UPI0021F60208|nr:rho GTPase-activating protein 15-like [Leptopilina boulardi]
MTSTKNVLLLSLFIIALIKDSLCVLPAQKKTSVIHVDLDDDNLGPIEKYKSENPPYVPSILVECFRELDSRVQSKEQSEQLYLVGGGIESAKELMEKLFDENTNVDLSLYSVQVIAKTVLYFLSNLEESIIPPNSMYVLSAAVEHSKALDKEKKLKIFIENLPEIRRNTLALIIIHLKQIAKKTNYDLTVVRNIEMKFGPTLIQIDFDTIPGKDNLKSYYNLLYKIISGFLDLPFKYWNSIVDYETVTAYKPFLRKRNDVESSMESASGSASSEQMAMKERRRGRKF